MTENEPLSVTEVMQRCSDQCNRMEKNERATFSIKGIRMLLAEITELRRILAAPSARVPITDEMVERALNAAWLTDGDDCVIAVLGQLDDDRAEHLRNVMRAALEAALNTKEP